MEIILILVKICKKCCFKLHLKKHGKKLSSFNVSKSIWDQIKIIPVSQTGLAEFEVLKKNKKTFAKLKIIKTKQTE